MTFLLKTKRLNSHNSRYVKYSDFIPQTSDYFPSVWPWHSVVRRHTNTTCTSSTFFTRWRCCYCRRCNAWSGDVLRTCMSETWCRHEEQSGSGSRQTDITNRAQIMMMTVTKMSRSVSGSEEAQLTLNAHKSWCWIFFFFYY